MVLLCQRLLSRSVPASGELPLIIWTYHIYPVSPVSVCGSGLQDPIAYSLFGGGVPYPEHRLNWSLYFVPMFRFLCFPSVMVWSLPFPPSKIQPSSLLYKTSCPSPLYFRPNCLLSALGVTVVCFLNTLGRKERGDGQDVCRARNPAESRRGGKEGTKTSPTGNIET